MIDDWKNGSLLSDRQVLNDRLEKVFADLKNPLVTQAPTIIVENDGSDEQCEVIQKMMTENSLEFPVILKIKEASKNDFSHSFFVAST